MDGVIEHLIIKNFFSIKKFDWKIKDFNVLTGGMAAGKSICIKLVYFLEHILHKNIFFPAISHDTLKKEVFYDNISKQFNHLFHSENPEKDFCSTEIIYTFSVTENNMVFDLSSKWNESAKKLEWKSDYIDTHIDTWRKLIDGKENNSGDTKKEIMRTILQDFLDKFPTTPWFIPASRAIVSVIENTAQKNILDAFLLDFANQTKYYVSSLNNVKDMHDHISKIYKLMKIKEMNIYYDIVSIESGDGRKITPLEFSSGQQELLYLLLLIAGVSGITFFHDENKNPVFIFNNNFSVFIEEPSSHLFPKEQKDTIEFITETFRLLKDKKKKNARFFITTHSPYVLNVINNMLKKGGILDRNKAHIKKINKQIKFPHLLKNELSAIFINKNGKCTDMFIEKEEDVLFADDIAEISFSINKDTNMLDDLNNELIYDRELNNGV